MHKALSIVIGLIVSPALAADGCYDVEHLGDSYTVCQTADASRIDLWRADAEGDVYGEFQAIEAILEPRGVQLRFAMNGGMYHEDRRAVGYYVDAHGQQTGLTTREGPGNFGLLPNGVFCVDDGVARVIETLAFEKEMPDCRIATQSGPMLVVDGKLHPRFQVDSDSFKRRNGIGVGRDGRVYFAISDSSVRFHDFGTLFRDVLNTPNALFLDGTVSRLYAPELGRSDIGTRMGPIIGVVEAKD